MCVSAFVVNTHAGVRGLALKATLYPRTLGTARDFSRRHPLSLAPPGLRVRHPSRSLSQFSIATLSSGRMPAAAAGDAKDDVEDKVLAARLNHLLKVCA